MSIAVHRRDSSDGLSYSPRERSITVEGDDEPSYREFTDTEVDQLERGELNDPVPDAGDIRLLQRIMEEAPADPQESVCSRWRGRIVSVAALAISTAILTTSYSRLTNAIGSLGIGLSSGYGVSSGVEDKITVARIRQVCLTIFGQATFFALTQVFFTTTSLGLHAFLVQALISQLGWNAGMCAQWLYQQGAVRVGSNPPEESKREHPEDVECIGHKTALVAKVLAAAGCATTYFLSSDRIIQGVVSFLSTFFGSQVLGELSVDALDHQIKKNDSLQGTRYRIAQTGLLTLGHILQPLFFIPWGDPGTAGRVRTLFAFGFPLGFFNGVSDRSAMRKIEQFRDEALGEFDKLKPPEKPKDKKCSIAYCAYRVFRYAVPLLSIFGMIGFTIWQVGWKLKKTDSKIALGMTLAGSLTSYGLSRMIDRAWNPKKRHWLIDKLMYALWASPRILGINPLFIYYAVTNALEMDGDAIGAEGESPYHVAAVILGWIAYGMAMGRELYITESERIGNPELKRPSMLYINGATTLKLYLSGAYR